MNIKTGLAAILLTVGFSVHAETDNFNVSLTGTFDNTVPDVCTVTPIGAINLGTLSMYDVLANMESNGTHVIGEDAYDTGSTVDVVVNCTVGTNYEFGIDSDVNTDGNTGARFWLFDAVGGNFLNNGNLVVITGTGTGVDQTHTLKVNISNGVNPITDLSGNLSIVIPATLTVL